MLAAERFPLVLTDTHTLKCVNAPVRGGRLLHPFDNRLAGAPQVSAEIHERKSEYHCDFLPFSNTYARNHAEEGKHFQDHGDANDDIEPPTEADGRLD